MKKYTLMTLLVTLFAFNSFAQILEVGDRLIIKEKITFLAYDGQGILDIGDLFQAKTYLRPGYIFKVTDEYSYCNTKKMTGKYFRTCHRRMTLESDNCGVDSTDGILEQIKSINFKFLLNIKDSLCKITVIEQGNDAGMFSKISEKILAEDSPLQEYMVKIID